MFKPPHRPFSPLDSSPSLDRFNNHRRTASSFFSPSSDEFTICFLFPLSFFPRIINELSSRSNRPNPFGTITNFQRMLVFSQRFGGKHEKKERRKRKKNKSNPCVEVLSPPTLLFFEFFDSLGPEDAVLQPRSYCNTRFCVPPILLFLSQDLPTSLASECA